MINFYFRFINEDGKPTGYIGYVQGTDARDVFERIDQYGNPYFVELSRSHGASYCKLQTEDGDEIEDSSFEFDESEPFATDKKRHWYRPTWDGILTEKEAAMYKLLEGMA